MVSPWFVRNVYRPVAETLTGSSFSASLTGLRQSEKAPGAEREATNWTRLQRLLRLAEEHVPYYRDKWAAAGVRAADIRTPEDFRRLPLLTRDDLIDSCGALLNRSYAGPVWWVETSGSTGRPIRVRQTRWFHSWTEAAQWRARGWFGVEAGDRVVALWGRPVKSRRERVTLAVRSSLRGMLHISAFDITEERLPHIWKGIVKHRPRMLYGYASALYLLAQWVDKHGEQGRLSELRVVMSTSEILYGFQRDLLAKVFAVPVSNVYGCGEVGAFAHECPQSRMHVSDENVLVEFLDGQSPVASGQTGDIVLTSLFNEGMPLIRYRVGDAGSGSSELCPCGRTLPTMGVTVGKAGEMVRIVGGRSFSTELFDYVHRDLLKQGITGVKNFRVVQLSLERFELQCVVEEAMPQQAIDRFIAAFRDALGAEVQVTLKQVAELQRDPGGKLRYFVRAS